MACAVPGRPLRLLHVDDDPINMMVLDQLLIALGHHPTGVASAQEALDLVELQSFDAVLSDIHMPQIDGVRLQQRLGELHPERPVFAVTADVMTRTQRDYEALGFAGVLAKPLDLPMLTELLGVAGRSGADRRFFAHGVAKG